MVTEYFVRKDGSDSNGGTVDSAAGAFLTILKGCQTMAAGDTLTVHSGTYVEGITNTIPGGTDWNTFTLVRAYPGDTVVLQPSSGSFVFSFSTTGRQYIELRDLVIDGAGGITTDCVKITASTAVSYAHHIRLRRCEVKNAPAAAGNGILVTFGGVASSPNGNEFIDCIIHDNGKTNSGRHGIYCETHNNLFQGNRCYKNGGFGIQQYKSGDITFFPDGNQILGNRCYDNNQSGGGEGGVLVTGTNTLVANNICYNNVGTSSPDGIRVGASDCGADGVKVYNNTVYGQTTGTGILVRSEATNTVVRDCAVYNNSTQYSDPGAGANGTVQDNNLNIPSGTTDPKFVDAANADFHLQITSPCINAGTSTAPDVTTDFDGIGRPQGTAYDIGAFEFYVGGKRVLVSSAQVHSAGGQVLAA